MTWFCFCFDFVSSHARCGCSSMICLCFQDVQIKQIDCKMRTKNWIILNKRHFTILLGEFLWNRTSKVKGVEEFKTQMDKGVGGLENWIILRDVMCVSSLINILKFSKESIFLKVSGRRLQIFGPKKDILFMPWNTVLTYDAENWEIHRKSWGCSALGSNIPFVSVTSTWKFLLCVETEPSFCKRFSNDDFHHYTVFWGIFHGVCLFSYY